MKERARMPGTYCELSDKEIADLGPEISMEAAEKLARKRKLTGAEYGRIALIRFFTGMDRKDKEKYKDMETMEGFKSRLWERMYKTGQETGDWTPCNIAGTYNMLESFLMLNLTLLGEAYEKAERSATQYSQIIETITAGTAMKKAGVAETDATRYFLDRAWPDIETKFSAAVAGYPDYAGETYYAYLFAVCYNAVFDAIAERVKMKRVGGMKKSLANLFRINEAAEAMRRELLEMLKDAPEALQKAEALLPTPVFPPQNLTDKEKGIVYDEIATLQWLHTPRSNPGWFAFREIVKNRSFLHWIEDESEAER